MEHPRDAKEVRCPWNWSVIRLISNFVQTGINLHNELSFRIFTDLLNYRIGISNMSNREKFLIPTCSGIIYSSNFIKGMGKHTVSSKINLTDSWSNTGLPVTGDNP
jgi:hypothetical protein